ncbi:hypothetical protein BpHYR1_013588 [Brachionus plicatilis]|uniref:Uncharacterized protein n=1 Tax=Brachionus plicatilis TaxID=10195 RepID=A0A3M7RRU5_BRAPC|nr:hypothetical protein BpHYR1_013588 [Brachionus plicatilis]
MKLISRALKNSNSSHFLTCKFKIVSNFFKKDDRIYQLELEIKIKKLTNENIKLEENILKTQQKNNFDPNPDLKNSVKKICPLFQKCNGEGNSKSQDGKRHFAIESCPIFRNIDLEKENEKKMKELNLKQKRSVCNLKRAELDKTSEFNSIKATLERKNNSIEQKEYLINELRNENKKMQNLINEKNVKIQILNDTQMNSSNEPKKIKLMSPSREEPYICLYCEKECKNWHEN